MASSCKQDGGSAIAETKKKKSKTGTSSKGPSRSNSVPCLGDEDEINDMAWKCEICCKVFDDPQAMMMECQRCKLHFCIVCLDKNQDEYKFLQKSDAMWFCGRCRESVEKNIMTDLKIEERCKQIMANYENRLTTLEEKVTQKCDEKEVRSIVNDELEKKTVSQQDGEVAKKQEHFDTIFTELNERKNRESNIMIYGVNESDAEIKEEREQHDQGIVKEILKTCKTKVKEVKNMKVIRLGKKGNDVKNSEDRQEMARRPLLVVLDNVETKRELFKNIAMLKKNPKLDAIRLSNDMTKAERIKEKELWEEAKKRNEGMKSGEFRFKIRGPPWARKLVKIPTDTQ